MSIEGQTMSGGQPYRFGPFLFDPVNARVVRGADVVPLTPKALAVLQYLIERQGRLVNKTELLAAVWPGTVVSEGVLKVSILELRKALGDNAKTPQFIETVHRRGYRFIGQVASSQYAVVSSGELSGVRSPVSEVRSPQSPAPGPQHPGPVLVGREVELAQLHSLFANTLNGKRQVVFVTGEPGIGKTALVKAFLGGLRNWEVGSSTPPLQSLKPGSQTPNPGPWVAYGQCVEHYGGGEAYLPVLEALSRLCRDPAGEQLVAILRQYAPMWLAQMPWLLSPAERETLARELAGASRERMLREMADALEAITTEVPLVLVLEDLHWSDYSTLDLLAAVARRSAAARFMVIGTYRPVDIIVSGHPLKVLAQELRLRQQCTEVPLELLDSAAVAAYLARRFPEGTVDASSFSRLAQVLHQRTGGNPLFLVNVVNELVISSAGGDHEGEESLEKRLVDVAVRVPDNIRQMIGRQSERLPPDEQRLLEGASVAGVEFSAVAVAAATESEVMQVEVRCEALARRGQFFVSLGTEELPDGAVTSRYGFAHALYQHVLYDCLGALPRRRMHQRIGEQEEARYGDRARERATELAMHFERGGDIRKAVRYRHYAGENALRHYGYREAIDHLQRGLELLLTLPDTPERAQQELALQLTLGGPLTATRGYAAPEVAHVYSRARELCQRLGEAPQLFPVLCGLCRFYIVRADLRTAWDISGQLVSLAQATSDPGFRLAAHNLAGVTLFYRGELPRALASLEQGQGYYDVQTHSPPRSQLFRSVQDPWVTDSVHAAWAQWLLGYPDRAAASMQAALSHARGLAHPLTLAYACHFAAGFYYCRGESRASQEQEDAAFALSTKHGLVVFLALGAMHRGWQLIERGRTEPGMAQLRQGLAEYRATGGALRQTMFLAMLAEACGKTGRPAEGLTVLAEALDAAGQTGERFYAAELYRLRGEFTLQQFNLRGSTFKVENPQPACPLRRGATRLPPPAGGDPQLEAETCFLEAIDIARKQQAKSLELRAVLSLVRLRQQQVSDHATRTTQHGPRARLDKAHRMLSQVYNWFTEGFDTKDLQEARGLLDSLASRV